MRWLLDALMAVVDILKDSLAASPRFAHGGVGLVFLLAFGLGALMVMNPGRYWWVGYVLIGIGVVLLFVLMLGLLLLGNEMASSGQMGGRTGLMLKDLDGPPPEGPHKKEPPVRRKGDAVPDWKVKPRAEAARAILAFLSDSDPAFDELEVVRWVEETTVRVREAIEAGDLGPVAARLTANCRRELQSALDALAAERARQVFGKVSPLEVQPVLVDAPANPERHAVTALVTLKSRDYVVDDRTDEVRDGNKGELVVTQEFWSFRRDGRKWRLDRVRPAADADDLLDVLNELSADRYDQFRRTAPRPILDHVLPVDG